MTQAKNSAYLLRWTIVIPVSYTHLYTALRVEIGEAKGQNWWCVLYPNLCFLDAVNAVVPEEGKQKLEQVLTEEEYRQVTAGGKFEIRFKLPELLGSL